MISVGDFNLWMILISFGQASALSYNQPKFCPNASWNPNATTFANISTIGSQPYDIFVNTNNTIFVANRQNSRIVIWSEESVVPTRTISGSLTTPWSLFVTTANDIYVDSDSPTGRIDQRTFNWTVDVPIMYTCSKCMDIFVDIDDNLYCAMSDLHQVITKSLNSVSNALTIVAGTNINGSEPDMLNQPCGIFVDINLDLYVADSGNDRIQLFGLGQSNAITIAGNLSSNTTITLNRPTGIVLDGDNNLYIVDSGNNRIVGSGPNGFQCLVGCGGNGSASNQLYQPFSLSFDSYGNMFVTDRLNDRIQQFILLTDLCDEIITSTMNIVNTSLNTTESDSMSSTTQSDSMSSTTEADSLSSTTESNSLSSTTTSPSTKIVSYNQPNLNAVATWSANAITFATNSTVGSSPWGIFVNTNNTIYVADRANGEIQVWSDDSINQIFSIYGNLSSPSSVFVTTNGDIYIDNGYLYGRVDKWTLNANTSVSVPVMYVDGQCYGVFVDIHNTLYCSIYTSHKVVTKSLNSNSSITTITAGTGCIGSTSNTLSHPAGIFVDINLDLYVADSGNNRIQLFQLGQLNGITFAGDLSPSTTITLNNPTAVALDADNNLFIVDSGNNRIVGSGQNGYRCLVGCSDTPGSATNQLNTPTALSFDSYGNMFVTDTGNNRIQKFVLLNNTLVPFYNQPQFPSNAVWNPNGITFANSSAVGSTPYGIFVDTNNAIYSPDPANGGIQVWSNNSINPTQTISGYLSSPYSIFVTSTGDIYVDNEGSIFRVDKWTLDANTSVPDMYVNSSCSGLFVDTTNTLYCSMYNLSQVIKRWLDDTSVTLTVIAGTNVSGSAPDMLNQPYGIFVDINFDLYVADSGNDRIQLFGLGQSYAITVAGNSLSGTTITLNGPTGIVLDGDGYLFIVDRGNNRIVGSGPNGFRCLVGCYSPGKESNQLSQPFSLSFDIDGNMFVTDTGNNRIQKFVLLNNSLVPSYNQPIFDPYAVWNPNGITFANSSTVGSNAYGIFVDTNNTIYSPDPANGGIQVWSNNSINPTQTISGYLSSPYSIFVTSTGDIYVDNEGSIFRVDKWTLDANTSVPGMYVNSSCLGLFVDSTNTLYCSMYNLSQIVKRWLDDTSTTLTVIAGTNVSGSAPDMLNQPHGIFVDINFDLYVADSGNDRIQLFQLGQSNGITVAGTSSQWTTITLNGPTGIVLDGDSYLFIVDRGNSRIVGSGPYGFRCLVGCYSPGKESNQLSQPFSLSFDIDGNMFVTDSLNDRIQKFILLNNTHVRSYNQPKFCSNASWYPNATTFANSSTVGSTPYGIFVNTNNTIYSPDRANGGIQVWSNNSTNPTRTIFGNFSSPYSIFVTTNGDIYVDNEGSNLRVDKWTLDANTSVPVMYVNSSCFGLFVDTTNTLYCSMYNLSQIVKKWLDDNSTTLTVVAGTNVSGSAPDMLNKPCGIFVDINLDLYVADFGNDRIQLFGLGRSYAITVAGILSSSTTITLNGPTGIVLDADKYLFIVDSGNNRIVGSGPDGFRCLAGCDGNGSASNQLSQPFSLSFDIDGNMFVTDTLNDRIRKFILFTNSCIKYEYTTQQSMLTSTLMEDEDTTRQLILKSTLMEDEDTTRQSILTSTLMEDEDTTRQSIFKSTLMEDEYTTRQSIFRSTLMEGESSSNSVRLNLSTIDTTVFHPEDSITSTFSINQLTTLQPSSSSPFSSSPSCPNPYQIGIKCSISATPCDMMQPCQANSTCINNNSVSNGYTCLCSQGFSGATCNIDNRLCKPNTCLSNGICNETSNVTFECLCQNGWTGDHCELKVNYCENVTCLNNGLCRPLLLNYSCECLGTSFSGRHCEIVSQSTVIHKVVSKSFGYVAILFLISIILFFVIMDILKYGFGIDPSKGELDKIRRRRRQPRKPKPPPVIQKFVYINAQPPVESISQNEISIIDETTI